jgi:hypothetical protein
VAVAAGVESQIIKIIKSNNNNNNNMEGPPPNAYSYGGHPAPDGASPTQPYKCSQYVKVKIKNRVGVDF